MIILTTFAKLDIDKIECAMGRYAATLISYSAEASAIKVIRAWGGPLFKGATFTVHRKGAGSSLHSWPEIAAMFNLPIPKSAIARAAAPAPVVVRKSVRMTRPPRAKTLTCDKCRGPYVKECPRCSEHVAPVVPALAPVRAPAPTTPTVGYFLPADQIAA